MRGFTLHNVSMNKDIVNQPLPLASFSSSRVTFCLPREENQAFEFPYIDLIEFSLLNFLVPLA